MISGGEASRKISRSSRLIPVRRYLSSFPLHLRCENFNENILVFTSIITARKTDRAPVNHNDSTRVSQTEQLLYSEAITNDITVKALAGVARPLKEVL